MKNTLVDMMSNFIDVTEDEKLGILEAFPINRYPKGTNLLKEGQITKDAFFVIKGCVRKYSHEDGIEKTSEFYT